MAMGERGGFGAVGRICFIEDIAQVIGNRVQADKQVFGNFLVRASGGDTPEYLHLALRQTGRVGGSFGAPPALRACDVDLFSESLRR